MNVHTAPATQTPAVNLAVIKARQQATWASGDYATVGTTLQIVGEHLVEAMDIRSGQSVLDVAAGNGNASLAAARRFAVVTSTDYVLSLLDRGRERAAADRLEMIFREADAEELPFDDASFDAVISTFGVMFAPDQERAAAEMVRVVRHGGKIGLANWTPDGFIGQLFKTIGRHLPPPAGLKSPALWGMRERIDELFGDAIGAVSVEKRTYTFRYRSPAHWVDVFRTTYGPVLKTFLALDPPAQVALADDLITLAGRFNRSGDDTMVVPSEYLEVVMVRS